MKTTSQKEEYRADIRSRAMIVALQQFREKGIRAVKMDDISRLLGISKRTLYEVYPNKEELVRDCINEMLSQTQSRLRRLFEGGASVIQVIIEFARMKFQESRNVNHAIYEDIASYPVILKVFEEHKAKNEERSRQFFLRGKEDGYFIKDVDDRLVSRFINTIIEASMRGAFNDYSHDEVFHTMLQCFVRGICTPKGIAELDRFLETI